MMNELTELEKLAVEVSEEDDCSINKLSKIINKLIEEGQKITERIKPKPMFPAADGYVVHACGTVVKHYPSASRYAERGMAAYTPEEAKRIDRRNLARVRVLEKIYAANGGKVRGFIEGEYNYCVRYVHRRDKFEIDYWGYNQHLPNEFYFSEEAAEILKKDEDFKRDIAVWQGRE